MAVIARFKSLRTVPNILIANLSLVDLLNAAINMPFHLISVVWKTTFLSWLFIVLNLASMLALMVSMYSAITFGLQYITWATSEKALLCALLTWFLGTVMVILLSLPLLSIDLGDTHIIEYRVEIYNQGKYFVAAVMAFFVVCGCVIGFLTTRSINSIHFF